MEFDHISEEPASASGNQTTQHYLYSKQSDLVIQATASGFTLRTELWLKSYLQTVSSGQALPGFSYHGKFDVSEDVIRPMIDGLSYKAHMEARLGRINRAISAQAGRIMNQIPGIGQAAMSS